MKQEIIQFSEQLDNAAVDAVAVEQLSNTHTISLSDAYKIQEASIARRVERGEKLSGIKLGFTSKAKMEQMGVHDLIWGRLTNRMQIQNHSKLHLTKFIHPRAEPEVAFLLKKDITTAITTANVGEFVSGVTAAIEIIDSRYKNFKFSLEDVIADNCSSTAYVLGAWQDFNTDSSNLEITMKVNDVVVQKGNSNQILGNPLNSLLEAFRLANQYNLPLKKDMVILAGAATPAVFIKENETVVVTIENLGEVVLHVE